MTNAERRFNFINSFPVASLLYGIPFGALMAGIGKGPFDWGAFAFCGLLFGPTMAFLMRRQYNKMPGMARSKEDWLLLEHLKKGTLPSNPKLLKAMPRYLDRNELQLGQSKKSLLAMLFFGLMSIFYGYSIGSTVLSLCGVFILCMMVYYVFNMKSSTEKIKQLREELQLKSRRSK